MELHTFEATVTLKTTGALSLEQMDKQLQATLELPEGMREVKIDRLHHMLSETEEV